MLKYTAKKLQLLIDGAKRHGLEKFKFDNISIRPSHVDDIVEAIYEELESIEGTVQEIVEETGEAMGMAGVIGEAEDGDYTDGIFTDFTPETSTGTAIDRLNELGLALAPPKADALSDWSGSKSGTVVSGRLSFDTNNPITGASYIGADTAIPSVTSTGLWLIGGKRIGIAPSQGGDITGILNDQVLEDTGAPSPAFPENSFGDGDVGILTMSINGIEVASIDLTTLTANDTTLGDTISGLNITSSFPTLFPKGTPLELFQNRTGTWTVVDDDPNLVQGYNFVTIEHNTGTALLTLDRFEWIIDDDVTPTVYSGESLNSLVMSGSKKVSGIDYHTGGSASYDITIDNAYRNTYSDSSSAISHTGSNLTASPQALLTNNGDETLQISVTGKVATITPATGLRLIDGDISLNTTTDRTVQDNLTSLGSSISNILLDSTVDSSTDLITSFDDERNRLPSNFDFEDFSSMVPGSYDSEQSIKTSDSIVGYNDQLQVIAGSLIYPGNNGSFPADFTTSNITNGSTFNDGGTKGTAREFTSESGNKEIVLWFKQISPTASNFQVNVSGDSGINFVSKATSLVGNNAHLEIKGPSQTGWLDGYVDFNAIVGVDNDGNGARSTANGLGGINETLGLTIGTRSTANTGGIIEIRITVADSFTLAMDNITFNFL